MPLTRLVHDSSEAQSTSSSQELAQVLHAVKNLEAKLDGMRTEREALKEHMKIQDGKLNDIVHYMQAVDGRLSGIEAHLKELAKGRGDASAPGVQMAVRDRVRKFCCDGDWAALRQSLVEVLDDEHSPEYKQLLTAASLYSVGTSGHTELAALLLDAGMHVDQANAAGFTLLHGAAEAGHLLLVRALLARGAGVNTATQLGSSPLIFASTSNQPEVVELLLRAGADVNARDREGWTSLHWAARKGYLPVVHSLVTAGARDAAAVSGKTALQMAREAGHAPVVDFLCLNPSTR